MPDKSSPGPIPPRSARAVGGDRQVHAAAFFQQFANGRHPAAIGRAADEIEAQVIRGVGKDFGVAMPA